MIDIIKETSTTEYSGEKTAKKPKYAADHHSFHINNTTSLTKAQVQDINRLKRLESSQTSQLHNLGVLGSEDKLKLSSFQPHENDYHAKPFNGQEEQPQYSYNLGASKNTSS